jgi:hypothetical protein
VFLKNDKAQPTTGNTIDLAISVDGRDAPGPEPAARRASPPGA